ncbi:hypothetical protein ACLXNF_04370 [Mycobacteroides chelonae]|uniref:hypothetical protein n=1 Tax=Mycobacteroides chelonae TaxID=1774 RepID=UPI0039E82473
MADDDEQSQRGKLYTDLSKVVTEVSQSRNGFSMPSFRRWRAPDAIAWWVGVLLTVGLPIATINTGYAVHVLIACMLLTFAAVFALSKLPKFGPGALTRLRWRLEARTPRTSSSHSVASLSGRTVDPRTGRLVTMRTGR